jgi:hypothetical protein
MRRIVFASAWSLVLLLGHVAAQTDAEVSSLQEKATRHLESTMPGWKHERGEPIRGSERTSVDFWSFQQRKVKIEVVPYGSAQRAKDAFQEFSKYEPEREELTGFGDDAFAWGYAQSNVAFRRGRFIIYVSSYAAVESDPDGRTLSAEQKNQRQRSEMRKWSKEFAKHMSTALDQP